MAGPNYSLPAWLDTAPNWGQLFASGVQTGAQIGEARNKLAAQQQQFAVEAQQKQDQISAAALKEAQELQVSKSYNDQQIALKQQQLEIADKKVGAETIKAGRMYQAQQQYQKDYQEGVDSGMSEDDAAKGAMFKNLSMFGSGAGAASAVRSMSSRGASIPQTMDVSDIGGKQHRYIYRGPGSTMHEVGGGSSAEDKAQRDTLMRFELPTAMKDYRAADKSIQDAIGMKQDTAAADSVIGKQYAAKKALLGAAKTKYESLLEKAKGSGSQSAPTSTSNAKFRYNPETGKIEEAGAVSEPTSSEPDETDTEE